jgi:hypothetical protein
MTLIIVKHQGVNEMLAEIGDWVCEDGDMNNAIDNPQETATINVSVQTQAYFSISDPCGSCCLVLEQQQQVAEVMMIPTARAMKMAMRQ